jgi:hypothetical protein
MHTMKTPPPESEKSTMVRVSAELLATIDEIARKISETDPLRRAATRADVVRYLVREYQERNK